MNVYDTANKLAGEIKQSEEYMNYKMAKQALSLNSKLKEQLQEFEKIRYEVQVELMQTGKNNEEKYKKIIFVLKNIRIPIRSGLIIKEEIK